MREKSKEEEEVSRKDNQQKTVKIEGLARNNLQEGE